MIVLLLLSFLWLWGSLRYDWDAITGFYFAVACLSTAGTIAVPDDAEDFDYFIVALATALGVPILNIAIFGIMTAIVQMSMQVNSIGEIWEGITTSELRALRALGVHETAHDAPVGHNEFVVMIMMRVGLLDADTYQRIYKIYHKIDDAARLGELPDVGPAPPLGGLGGGQKNKRRESKPAILVGAPRPVPKGRQLTLIDLLAPDDQKRVLEHEQHKRERQEQDQEQGQAKDRESKQTISSASSASSRESSGEEDEEEEEEGGGEGRGGGSSRPPSRPSSVLSGRSEEMARASARFVTLLFFLLSFPYSFIFISHLITLPLALQNSKLPAVASLLPLVTRTGRRRLRSSARMSGERRDACVYFLSCASAVL